MRILVSIRIHNAQLKYILIFTPFITFSIDLGNYHLRMGVSIEEYRQRIGCFVRALSSFKVRGNNNTTYQKQSKDFGTALRVIIRCVDYAIKISTMVIINTGYNNHAAHLYILVQ